MRIAISAKGPTLDAEVDPRFGRCEYFIIVDPQTMEFEAVENASSATSGGAGIAAGQMIVGKGVEAVLTGNFGPNAYQVLSAAGLRLIGGVSGKVRDVVQAYKAGQLQASLEPSAQAHSGIDAGLGIGRGGMGRGRGMGRGMGGGVRPLAGLPPQPVDPKQELEELKAESQALGQRLDEIQRRIEEIENKRR